MKYIEFLMKNKEYLEDFVTRSTYHSNGIEGNTLTYVETYALLYNDNRFKLQGVEPREIYETLNHKKALELVFDTLKEDLEIDERFIKKLNEIINKDIKDTEGYRREPVVILGTDYIPPEAEKIPNLMLYFMDNYKNDVQDIFERVARYHINFEKIHPFLDGNGRTGRLLINYELMKNNLPPVVIEKDDRTKYFEFFVNKDSKAFSEWLKELSLRERKRMEKFGLKEIEGDLVWENNNAHYENNEIIKDTDPVINTDNNNNKNSKNNLPKFMSSTEFLKEADKYLGKEIYMLGYDYRRLPQDYEVYFDKEEAENAYNIRVDNNENKDSGFTLDKCIVKEDEFEVIEHLKDSYSSINKEEDEEDEEEF